MISTKQISHIAALLTASLSEKVVEGADLSQADWTAIETYMQEQGYDSLVSRGLTFLSNHGVAVPAASAQLPLRHRVTADSLAFIKDLKVLGAFSAEGYKAKRGMIGLGGFAFADCYPAPALCGAREILVLPIYLSKEAAQERDKEETRLEVARWTIVYADKAVGERSDKREGELDSALQEAFSASNCRPEHHLRMLLPNDSFRALYHLYHSQEQLLAGALPFRNVIDWVLLLQHIAKTTEEFDWADLWQRAAALGLNNFGAAMTALGQQLTGVELPEAACPVKASQKTAEALMAEILNPAPVADTDSRFGRFFGVLRHSSRYARFTDTTVMGEAFRQLFPKE